MHNPALSAWPSLSLGFCDAPTEKTIIVICLQLLGQEPFCFAYSCIFKNKQTGS